MTVSSKQGKFINLMKRQFKEFIDIDIEKVVINVVDDPEDGCFSPKYSQFHRIDRFYKLCNRIRDSIHSQLSDCLSEAKNKVNGKRIIINVMFIFVKYVTISSNSNRSCCCTM